jgi:sugar-specific transcriptional regulator TrmB
VKSKSSTVKQHLLDLGLSPDEANIYLLLVSRGSLSAKAVSELLGMIVNSVYRSTNALIEKELIKELDITPKQFQAVSPNVALEQLAAKRILKIKESADSVLSALDLKENPNRLHMKLLTGRKELFDSFVDIAKDAQEEILVISIGEPVPESIWEVTKESLERGVKPKFIFSKYDKDNIMLIKRWQTMGVPVRHVPKEGYHLNIFDRTAAILSASNPEQSKERSGVVIYNEAIIEALREYFFQQWALAKDRQQSGK